ncbi:MULTISPECIES: ChaB family protein [Kaistia]|uniref:ChaB family protein n=1 Tax=Kaistia nematophila TaxID=2994654 RepID=A0A9X3IKS3_9HYPH|nr:ChaB family protein [Kaistia nematophila]MBN9024289.1 ChaB family protein [Hyphomicrobiales bacterium]MCX5569929.1 ChaB family protein [Kaistia nematophila]
MPYAELKDLPAAVRDHLPIHGQEIFRAAFNHAWDEYASRGDGEREEIARRVAWAAVKHKYRKDGDRWIAL